MGDPVPYDKTLGFSLWGWSRFVPGPVYSSARFERQFTDRIVAEAYTAEEFQSHQARPPANRKAATSPWSAEDLVELERLTVLLEGCGRRASQALDNVNAFVDANDPDHNIRLQDRNDIPELYRQILTLRQEDSSYGEESREIGNQIQELVRQVTGKDDLVPWTEGLDKS